MRSAKKKYILVFEKKRLVICEKRKDFSKKKKLDFVFAIFFFFGYHSCQTCNASN